MKPNMADGNDDQQLNVMMPLYNPPRPRRPTVDSEGSQDQIDAIRTSELAIEIPSLAVSSLSDTARPLRLVWLSHAH